MASSFVRPRSLAYATDFNSVVYMNVFNSLILLERHKLGAGGMGYKLAVSSASLSRLVRRESGSLAECFGGDGYRSPSAGGGGGSPGYVSSGGGGSGGSSSAFASGAASDAASALPNSELAEEPSAPSNDRAEAMLRQTAPSACASASCSRDASSAASRSLVTSVVTSSVTSGVSADTDDSVSFADAGAAAAAASGAADAARRRPVGDTFADGAFEGVRLWPPDAFEGVRL